MNYDNTGWNEQNGMTCHATLMKWVDELDQSVLGHVLKDCRGSVEALPEGRKSNHYQDAALYVGARIVKLRGTENSCVGACSFTGEQTCINCDPGQ